MIKSKLINFDWGILIVTLALVLLGSIMLASATVVIGQDLHQDIYFYFKRQLLQGVIPGLVLFFLSLKMNYHHLRVLSVFLFVVTLFLLVLVFVPGLGLSSGGATSWLRLGPLSFQPSEILKLTLIIYLAHWLENTKALRQSLDSSFIPFVILLMIISFLMILQPDLGTLLIILITSISTYFVADGNLKHLLGLLAVGLVVLGLVVWAQPYRLKRVAAFLNPQIDPLGINYQLIQSRLAIGSGGFWGLGLGNSRQKYQYLPEVQGDSIFAVISEELGFFMAGAIIIAFLYLALKGFKIAKSIPDDFGKYLAVGVTVSIVVQAYVNIGAMLGLLPLTGVTLPLISYGGTSMVISLTSLGLLLNLSQYRR